MHYLVPKAEFHVIAKEIVWNNLVLIQHDALMRTARQSSLGVHVVYTVGSAREHGKVGGVEVWVREWDV